MGTACTLRGRIWKLFPAVKHLSSDLQKGGGAGFVVPAFFQRQVQDLLCNIAKEKSSGRREISILIFPDLSARTQGSRPELVLIIKCSGLISPSSTKIEARAMNSFPAPLYPYIITKAFGIFETFSTSLSASRLMGDLVTIL